MQANPATTNESIRAGPVLSWAATPVSTKMPVPMMAPTPRLVSWTGPRTRRSRFSLFISSSRRLSGLVANNGLPRVHPFRLRPRLAFLLKRPKSLSRNRRGVKPREPGSSRGPGPWRTGVDGARVERSARAPTRLRVLPAGFLRSLALDLHAVHHAEGGRAPGDVLQKRLLDAAAHVSRQGDAAVLDDDAHGRVGPVAVGREALVSVDRPVQLATQPVVERGDRLDADLVADLP